MGTYAHTRAGFGTDFDSLASRLWMTELSLESARLSLLDDLWTSYLESGSDKDGVQADLQELQLLVGEMGLLLGSVSGKARELGRLIDESGVDLDQRLALLLEHSPGVRPEVSWRPLAVEVVEACAIVQRDSPQALVELAVKLQTIAEGEFTEGDLPRALKQAIVFVAIGAALIAVPGGPIALPALAAYGLNVGSIAVLGIFTLDELGKEPPPRTGDFKL